MKAGRIAITGGSGFIGSHLTRRLVEEGCQVTHWRSGAGGTARISDLLGRIRRRLVDFTSPDAVRSAIGEDQPEVIYHLASTPFNPPGTPARMHVEVIVQQTVSILEAMAGRGGTRLVCAGSGAEYGSGARHRENSPVRPATMLGAAKACATAMVESYARRCGLEAVVLRIFTPFGPWEHPHRLIPSAILAALAGCAVRITAGSQQRDFFYVADLIDALLAAGTAALDSPAVINICSGEARRVGDVAASVVRLTGGRVPVEAGALGMRPDEIAECSGDNRKARQLLGWAPRTGFEEGLAESIRWFRDHPEWAEAACCN